MIKKSLLCLTVFCVSYCFAQNDIDVVDQAEQMYYDDQVSEVAPEQNGELTLENLLSTSSSLQEFYNGLSDEEQADFAQLVDELRIALYDMSSVLEEVVERHANVLSKLKTFIGVDTLAFRLSLHAE